MGLREKLILIIIIPVIIGIGVPLFIPSRYIREAVTIGGLATILSIIVILDISLNKYFITPIKDLHAASKSITTGDFNINLPIKGRDEVGELEKTFMVMAASIRLKTAELMKAEIETILCLAQAIEAKDFYIKGHGERTANQAVQIAERLGLSEKEKDAIRYAAILHDIGKIGIKGSILNKTCELTPEEYEEIKTHPIRAVEILNPIRFLEPVIPLVLYHHERWDGKGYPVGLSGESIPIGARIICLLDSFDAMTSDRPYRKAMSLDDAIATVKRLAGSQFDPKIAAVFLEIIEKEKA